VPVAQLSAPPFALSAVTVDASDVIVGNGRAIPGSRPHASGPHLPAGGAIMEMRRVGRISKRDSAGRRGRRVRVVGHF